MCAFDLVLRLRRGDGLPLHVARHIGTAAGERLDVIDHVARTTMWIPGLPRERMSSRFAPLDSPAIVLACFASLLAMAASATRWGKTYPGRTLPGTARAVDVLTARDALPDRFDLE